VFQKLKVQGVFAGAEAARDFGIALVALGIGMLVLGMIYHLQFMDARLDPERVIQPGGTTLGA
jgi:putative membrane protein